MMMNVLILIISDFWGFLFAISIDSIFKIFLNKISFDFVFQKVLNV